MREDYKLQASTRIATSAVAVAQAIFHFTLKTVAHFPTSFQHALFQDSGLSVANVTVISQFRWFAMIVRKENFDARGLFRNVMLVQSSVNIVVILKVEMGHTHTHRT